jgi:hypothetical protein
MVKPEELCHKANRDRTRDAREDARNRRGVLKVSRKNPLSAKILVVAVILTLSHWSFAASYNGSRNISEDPSALAMTADLLLVRPAMLAMTVLGSAVWLVGLPFAAAGGNLEQTTDTLVLGPAKNTFVRCLGCTKAGYRQAIEMEE